jgi:predicted metal-dependent HD superfamily phosphohydrolase
MFPKIKICRQLSAQDLDYLMFKFHRLFEPLDAKNLIPLQHSIFNYYQESHRAYHNLSHIFNLLQLSEQLDILTKNAFELAIWYHDMIYQPQFKDNEEQSADLFLKHYNAYFSTSPLITTNEKEWIYSTILSTAGHQPRIEHPDTKLFLDADLSILASETDTYETYVKAIREEYNIYPDELYYQGRKQAISRFLEREKIYFTDVFAPFEHQARQNILLEISNKCR